jgi:hypothetical protein
MITQPRATPANSLACMLGLRTPGLMCRGPVVETP